MTTHQASDSDRDFRQAFEACSISPSEFNHLAHLRLAKAMSQDAAFQECFELVRFALGEDRDTLHIEARFPAATLAELERRGHKLNRWSDYSELAGHAHGIFIDPVSGVRIGGSDPRSDGAAIGY